MKSLIIGCNAKGWLAGGRAVGRRKIIIYGILGLDFACRVDLISGVVIVGLQL